MRSAGTPTATVLTVVTLVFAPVVKHHHTTQQLVDNNKTTVTVVCSNAVKKCPGKWRMHERVNVADSSPATIQAAIAASVAKAIADFQAGHPGASSGGGTSHGHGCVTDGQHGYDR
jgi:hypothetical protein